jgi:hypothetical protein
MVLYFVYLGKATHECHVLEKKFPISRHSQWVARSGLAAAVQFDNNARIDQVIQNSKSDVYARHPALFIHQSLMKQKVNGLSLNHFTPIFRIYLQVRNDAGTATCLGCVDAKAV